MRLCNTEQAIVLLGTPLAVRIVSIVSPFIKVTQADVVRLVLLHHCLNAGVRGQHMMQVGFKDHDL